MDHGHGFRQAPLRVGDDLEMGELGLGLLGGWLILERNDDHTNLAVGELLRVRFELTQLDHAHRSPAAAKEGQHAPRAVAQVLIGERSTVGVGGDEGGNRRPAWAGPS
jgi:hypothetical protein